MINRSAILAGFFIAASFIVSGNGSHTTDAGPTKKEVNLMFQKNLAEELDAYYHSIRVNTSSKVIWQVIDEAQHVLPYYFQGGEVGIDHILAIASLESNFHPKARGAAGEVGIFQILRPGLALTGIGMDGSDPMDVRTNTRMGILVLSDKYRAYGNLTKAIIAYNGVVKKKDGSWDDQYLRKFRKNHARILKMIRKAEERVAEQV